MDAADVEHHTGDGHENGRYELVLDLLGCRRDVFDDPGRLRDLAVGLWEATVGTSPPNTVVTRLPNGSGGYSVTQMGSGCTLAGRFETPDARAQIHLSSTRLLNVSAAESFVREAFDPSEILTG